MNLFSPEGGQDTIYIERDGERRGPFKCNFGHPKQTSFFYKEFDIEEGDTIFRPVPGKEETYTVTAADYSPGLGGGSGIPPHWTISTVKKTAYTPPRREASHVINIHGSSGIQIGNHNVQHLEAGLKELLAAIDKSEGDQAAKEEAKGRLKGFLEHPLTASAVGAGLPALMALFGVSS